MNRTYKTAQGIASLGRGPDKMLVHMSPTEVAGLQKLAVSTGGSLSINPKTGLVEAGWLESILPMVAGAAAVAMTGGAATPMVAAMYGGLAGGATGAIANRHNGQSTLSNFGMGALGGAGGGMGAAALANIGAGAAAGGAAAGGAGSAGAAAPTLAQLGTGSAAAGAGGASGGATLAQLGTGAAEAGTGTGTAIAAPVAQSQTALMGQGLHSLSASQHPMLALKAAGYGRIPMAMTAAPLISNAMSPAENSSSAPKDKVRYWNTRFNQDTGQYGPSSWGDSFPGYAMGGQVPMPPPRAASAPMGKVDPATLQSYMDNINTQNQTPAYMNNPNSYYNPQGQPPLQPQNPQSQPPRAVMNNPSVPPDSSMQQFGYNPSTQQYSNAASGLRFRPNRYYASGGMTDDIDPNNPSTWTNAGNPNDGANQITSTPTYDPQTGTYSGSSTYREPTPGKSHGPWGGFVDKANHGFGIDHNKSSMDPLGPIVGHHFGMMASGGAIDGPGDGMSDSIPASIDGKQPARLGSGEFVVPADVVSHLGNGSSTAGARRLYSMMDKVRQARTGQKSQAKEINVSKYLPK